MYENKKIILLPSKEASHIHYIPVGEYDDKHKITKPKLLFTDKATEYGYPPMHFYIIDDSKIKVGEHCFHSNIKKICIADEFMISNPDCKKIIATTDESIAVKHNTLSMWQGRFWNHYPTIEYIIPQISTSFIKKYVKSYNKGLQIKNILVKYITVFDIEICSITKLSDIQKILKVSSSNLIDIKTQKYNREEVEQLLLKILTGIGTDKNIIEAKFSLWNDTITFNNVQEWIEQNLNK